jgi:15-cis-phytoene synthase
MNAASSPSPSSDPVRRPSGNAPANQAALDLATCRDQLRDGSRTFLAASMVLPAAVRDPACALYAFCRSADDAVDLEATDELAAVARLRTRLERIYRADPEPTACDRSMARVVADHRIPRALPAALLDGFEWDALGRRYETIEALHEYGARVAGSVGAMMALLMGVRSPEGLARACDLGVAMQLSNIARDVGEDARMGRVYLPLQWLREAGIDPDAWLEAPRFDAALAGVVRRLLRAADELYERVDAGIALLPASCRPGISAARYLYAAIGHEVERRGYDSVSQRAVVPGSRKAVLLARAFAAAAWPVARAGDPAQPLAATRYLVDAVARGEPGPSDGFAPAPSAPPGRALNDRMAWTIELFERQERRRQMRRSTSLSS